MGKLMKFKKPKNGQTLQISKAEINEFNRALKQAEIDLRFEMIEQMALLCTAFAKDEEYIDNDPDKIVEMFEKLTNWAERIDDHTITIDVVVDIINESAGREIVHWGQRK